MCEEGTESTKSLTVKLIPVWIREVLGTNVQLQVLSEAFGTAVLGLLDLNFCLGAQKSDL